MPQRFLRPGLTNSTRYNAVSFDAQSAYIRVLTRVDDYGQYDGRPAVILGDCFSVWNAMHPKEMVTLKGLVGMLNELITAGLHQFWQGKNGKIYLQVTQWQERVRAGCKPKWKEDGVEYEELKVVDEHTGNGQTVMMVVDRVSPTDEESPTVNLARDDGEQKLRSFLTKLFNRRETTRWDAKEVKALHLLWLNKPSDEDLQLVAEFHNSPATYHRQDIVTLLNNWNQEVSRAIQWKKNPNDNQRTQNGGGSFTGNARQTGADIRRGPPSGTDAAAIVRARTEKRRAEYAAEEAARASAQNGMAAQVVGP